MDSPGGDFSSDFIIEDLIPYFDHNVEEMSKALSRIGYAEDAARETYEVALIIRQARFRVETMQRRLYDVWRSVERWNRSKDNEGDFKEALAKYRGGTVATDKKDPKFEYRLVCTCDMDSLMAQVDQQMADGWRLQGGIYVVRYTDEDDNPCRDYYQAMVRRA